MKTNYKICRNNRLIYRFSEINCKWKVTHICILLITYVSFQSRLYSQVETQLVDLESPDAKRMEWITFESVNKLRQDKKIPDLIWDDVLYRAAKDHADYLIERKKLSHSQKNHEKRAPFNRVKIHGGIDYTLVGENLVSVTLGTQLNLNGGVHNTLTYNTSGQTMALLWKSSREHYRNIISEKYKYSALAVSYDNTTQRLVAVQVFGFSNNPPLSVQKPDYSNQLLKTSTKKLPYRLNRYRFNEKDQYAIDKFHKLDMDRGYLTGKYSTAKRIFKGRRSGITQEFIQISDYDSNSVNFAMVPNRRNGLYELNGSLSKPVYRRELLKYSRLHTNRGYIIYTKCIKIKGPTKELIYPLIPNSSGYEYNLFLLKNKRLVSHRTYMMIPSQLFTTPFPKMDFVAEFVNYEPPPKYKTYRTYDTLNLKVFYRVCETEIDSNMQVEILAGLDSIKGKVVDFQASAYASIEGTLSLNRKLAHERMAQFISLARPWLKGINLKDRLFVGENWELFYEQIEDTLLTQLGQLSKNEVRNYINRHKNNSAIRKLLNEERYMEFRIISAQDTKVPIVINQDPVQMYDSLLSLLNATKNPRMDLIKATEQAQLSYYNYLSQKDSITSYPMIPIPYLEKHKEFEYHSLVFRFVVLNTLTANDFYFRLHDIGYTRYFPGRLKNDLIYNNLLLIYNSYLQGNLNQLVPNVSCYRMRQRDFYFQNFKDITCYYTKYNDDYHTLSELPKFITMQIKIYKEKYTHDLWKYYYLNMITTQSNMVPFETGVYRYLYGFKKYFHPNNELLTDEERLKYSYFYCAIKKYHLAKELIEPIAIRDNPHIEGLKLYITLKYEDFEQLHDFTNYLITQFPRLGKSEWCDLWKNPSYLNALLLEDLKLKKFYNCNCNR